MKFFILLSFCNLFPLISLSQEIKSEQQIIVKFNSQSMPDYRTAIENQHFGIAILDSLNARNQLLSFELTGNKKTGDTYVLKLGTSKETELILKSYEQTDLFEYVEPNYIGHAHGVMGENHKKAHSLLTTPNDPYFYNRQWSHYNDGTFYLSYATSDADIDTDLAWDITQGDPNILVAILDSGIKLNHPEFSGRIWQNTNETIDGMDSDSNGYVDDIMGGWDFANGDNDPADDGGHGTNVAGIALASGNNGIGYAGVNWNSRIMACKILDSNGYGYYTWWAEAIYYAVNNGANVINMSVGGTQPSNLLENAVNYAYNNNVAVVVSAGNENSTIKYPAKYPNAFAIGSTNSNDTRTDPFFWDATSGSNFGPELDFVAPGNYIFGLSNESDTNYNSYWGGTSQAAPHVTGLISLMLSVDPNISVNEIRTILEETSEDQVGDSEDTPGWDMYYGYGRINAYQALTHPYLKVDEITNRPTEIFIYPNPLSGSETLHINWLHNNIYTIKIFDALGQVVHTKSEKANANSVKLSLPVLKSGVYYVKISRNGTYESKKLIIK